MLDFNGARSNSQQQALLTLKSYLKIASKVIEKRLKPALLPDLLNYNQNAFIQRIFCTSSAHSTVFKNRQLIIFIILQFSFSWNHVKKVYTAISINVVGSKLQAKRQDMCMKPARGRSECVCSLSHLHSFNFEILVNFTVAYTICRHMYGKKEKKNLRSHYTSLMFGKCSSLLLLPTLPLGLLA